MKRLLTIAITVLSFTAQGQSTSLNASTSTKQHNFLLFGSGVQYLNKQDVSLISGNKRFLSAANTTGYQFGLGYEYVNKYNISYTVSVSYGTQPIRLAWDFTFDNFDPEVDLTGEKLYYYYNNTSKFLNRSFLLGYDYHNRKLKNTVFQVKAGLGTLNRFNYDYEENAHVVFYETSPNEGNISQYASTDVEVGVHNGWYNDRAPYYTFYLGVKRPVSSKIIRDYRLGVTFTHAIMEAHGTESFNLTRAFYYNSEGQVDGIEFYNNMFRSFALTGSLTF